MATLGTPASRRTARRRSFFVYLKTTGIVVLLAIMVFDVILTVLTYRRPLWVIDEVMHLRLKIAGIDSKFVTVGPYRVHYFVGGKGKPLLLIHGLGSRSEDWTPQMPEYASNGFQVYAIDLLGCGRTDHPDIAYTIQEQTDLVRGFLEAVHVQQADIIGWSMGGWIALQYSLQNPERVRRLVVMDSAGLSFQTSLTPEVFQPRTIPELKRLEALLSPNPPWLPGFFNRALLRAMQRNFRVVDRSLKSMLAGKDLVDGRLGAIRVPTLVIWGEQDALIPVSVGFRMHAAIPHSILEIYSGCGHIGPATCAGKIVPRVIDFLHSKPPTLSGIHHY